MDENIKCFNNHANAYEEWFELNQETYHQELEILKKLIGEAKNGLDIGSGTGRFSIKPHISSAIEPSYKMREISLKNGIEAIEGVGENLPFKDESFNFSLMMTSLCFTKSPSRSLREAFRVTKKDGFILLGFIDKTSAKGKEYLARKEKSKFYKDAKFFSLNEIINIFDLIKVPYIQKESIVTDFGMVFLKLIKNDN